MLRYDNVRSLFDATVEFANRIFVSNGFTPAADYKLLMQTYYLTDITPLDFSQSEAAAREINRWVSRKTHNKIEDLLDASSITPLTRMMIINAIYFKANWKYKFDEKDTK